MDGQRKQPGEFVNWLRGRLPFARLIRIEGAGSHSWDLIFDCGRFICYDELFLYEVTATCPGKDMTWRCGCGRFRRIPAELLHKFRLDAAADCTALTSTDGTP